MLSKRSIYCRDATDQPGPCPPFVEEWLEENNMMSQTERMMQLRDILERTGFNTKVHEEIDYEIDAYLNSRW